MKDSKGSVCAKYVGLPIYGAKKIPFGCLKPWSLTYKDPRKFGYLKELLLFCRSIRSPEEDIGCLIVDALNT